MTFVERLVGRLTNGAARDRTYHPTPELRYLIDALRRSTELLEGIQPANAGAYWREERDHILAVNRRLLREHDPEHLTDRKVA